VLRSLIKSEISVVNHVVSAKYLQNYLDKCAFRYDWRGHAGPMFEAFVGQVVEKGEYEPRGSSNLAFARGGGFISDLGFFFRGVLPDAMLKFNVAPLGVV
jgi:hypothetical protein